MSTTKTPTQVHTEDLEEFVKETTGVREEPVREVEGEIDMAEKAFETMDPAGELTIGDLRTQLEAKLDSETTAVEEASRGVHKIQGSPSFLPFSYSHGVVRLLQSKNARISPFTTIQLPEKGRSHLSLSQFKQLRLQSNKYGK